MLTSGIRETSHVMPFFSRFYPADIELDQTAGAAILRIGLHPAVLLDLNQPSLTAVPETLTMSMPSRMTS